MAVLNVPSAYATITAAIAAASNDDIIVLASGTYTDTIEDASHRTGLVFRADYGASVTLTGRITLETGWVFRGVTISPADNSSYIRGAGSAAKVAHFIECSFDLADFSAATTNDLMIATTLAAGSTIQRCTFTGAAGVEIVNALSGTDYVTVDACVFTDCSSSYVLRARHYKLRNCNFYNCTGSIYVAYVAAADNCIFHTCTGGSYVLRSTTTANNNVNYNNTASTAFSYGATSKTSTGDPKFVDPANGNFYLQATSSIIGEGYSSNVPLVDANRFSFEAAPSRGAYEWFRGRSCLQQHYPALDLSGMKVAAGAGTPAAVTAPTVRGYAGGYEVAKALDLVVGDALGHDDHVLTYEPNGRYRCQGTAFSLSTTGGVGAVCGALAASNATDTD